MRKQFFAFFGVFSIIYGSANYYIGLRFWQSIFSAVDIPAAVYWIIYILLAATPIISRFFVSYLKGWLSVKLSVISGYWLGITFYAFFLWVASDIIRLLGQWSGLILYERTAEYAGRMVLALLIGLLVWGSYNARNPVIRKYQLSIAKDGGNLKQLKAVLIADVHLGPIIGRRRLEQLVTMVNNIKPDIIFFAGDTIDENVVFFAEKQMPAIFQKLKPPLGCYAVLGNHEYLGGQANMAVSYLEKSGMTVLRDNLVKVKDCFYIAGRDDPALKQMTGRLRRPLSQVLSGADSSLPLILIDHQPYDLNAAQNMRVDLMVAGHTHRGQFFPNNLVTSRVFEVDWGYLRKGALQVIVTCGFGTWGPPIRIGNKPEIVQIDIAFDGSKD